MHYLKVLEGLDSPEQISHRSFLLGASVCLDVIISKQFHASDLDVVINQSLAFESREDRNSLLL